MAKTRRERKSESVKKWSEKYAMTESETDRMIYRRKNWVEPESNAPVADTFMFFCGRRC